MPLALSALEMELDPETLVLAVDERVGVRSEPIHMAYARRQAAVRHQDRHLVQALRAERPEIPHRGRRAQIGPGMPLLGVDEIRELQRIAHEEYRRIVAHQI